MFLLDTNVISEARKSAGRADHHVVRWLDSHDRALMFVSVISLLELEIGVLRVERRDPPQGALLRTWLDGRVRPAFAGRILPVTDRICVRGARLHVPDPRPERDALIAATALEHKLTIVTRNVSDFSDVALKVLNPWELAG